MGVLRYGISLQVFKSFSHKWSQWTSEISNITLEEKFHFSRKTDVNDCYIKSLMTLNRVSDVPGSWLAIWNTWTIIVTGSIEGFFLVAKIPFKHFNLKRRYFKRAVTIWCYLGASLAYKNLKTLKKETVIKSQDMSWHTWYRRIIFSSHFDFFRISILLLCQDKFFAAPYFIISVLLGRLLFFIFGRKGSHLTLETYTS